MFPRFEFHEVPGGDRRSAASALELPVAGDDLAFEAEEPSTGRPNGIAVAVDMATKLRFLQDGPRRLRMDRDRFDSIDHFGQRKLRVFQAGEQLYAEFDRIVLALHEDGYIARNYMRVDLRHQKRFAL